jgi:hypothetical protein
MKTITMDYAEYLSESEQLLYEGRKQATSKFSKIVTSYLIEDFKEAHLILAELLGPDRGNDIFLELSKDNPAAQKWLQKEGLWKPLTIS